MWIDKTLYWNDDGNKTMYPSPTKKRIEYANIKYSNMNMNLACAVYDNDIKTELYADEFEWHRAHGAEIIYP